MSKSVSLRLALATLLATSLVARSTRAQTSVAADGSAVGVTRFELQRGLLEVDEQRRRLEASLEPVDSVLRVLAYDSTRIVSFERPRVVNRDLARVEAISQELRLSPDSPDLIARFIDAVNLTMRDFTDGEGSLGSRVLSPTAAQDYLARAPRAAVVPLSGDLPPRDTPLWAKIRESDYGKQPLARITYQDIAMFGAAVSDSGYQVYRATLLSAFGKRMAEIRQSRDSERAEIQRLRRKAADMAHNIGAQEDRTTRAESHAINVGLPVFAVVFITLLLAPRIYRSTELQQWIFTSGILLEITTLVLVIAGLLVLALAGRITEVVIGTVFGGVLGYAVGRATSRKVDVPVSVPAQTTGPAHISVSTTTLPVPTPRRAQA